MMLALTGAACSDDTVTLADRGAGSSTDAGVETDEDRAELVEAWTDEIFRDGDRTMTVSRARCIAQRGLDVLGYPLASSVLAEDQANENEMGVVFLAEDAASMAEVIVGCQDDDSRWRQLGTDTAPFAAASDIDCFVAELDTERYLTLVLRALDAEATIMAERAAATCGLI